MLTKKGLAMAAPEYQVDLVTLGINWWYVWGSAHYTDPNYVPMSWAGEDPNLPANYNGYLLLLNEPDRPDQSNKTVQEGLGIYKVFMLQYPNAKIVMGNVFYPDWLYEFKNLCVANSIRLPYAWGLHLYINGLSNTTYRLISLADAYNILGGKFWITEFADVGGHVIADDKAKKFFDNHNWIEKYAYFTNRAKGDEPWYPHNWVVQLFDWDTGVITQIGKWYAHGLFSSFLPIVIKRQG